MFQLMMHYKKAAENQTRNVIAQGVEIQRLETIGKQLLTEMADTRNRFRQAEQDRDVAIMQLNQMDQLVQRIFFQHTTVFNNFAPLYNLITMPDELLAARELVELVDLTETDTESDN